VGYDAANLPAAIARLETPPNERGCMLLGFELYRIVRIAPRHSHVGLWGLPGPDWAFCVQSLAVLLRLPSGVLPGLNGLHH
jgi:hypothetical protein